METIKRVKVLIFSGNKKDYKNVFYLGKSKIDNIEIYKYLGILFHKSNRFTKARIMLYTQVKKAMYFILLYEPTNSFIWKRSVEFRKCVISVKMM